MNVEDFRKLPLLRAWCERNPQTGRLDLHEERNWVVGDMKLTYVFPSPTIGRRDTS